jgi:demethylmenaquinone methyltransferase/2-methoxy-6-polyprenyl-1,4-benzoquinol methylase
MLMYDERVSRVHRSKESARASYDRMSRWYDWIAGRTEKKYWGLGLQKLGAKAGERILEIGFGTGDSLVSLARFVGGAGQVIGIDISENMLTIARKRMEQADLSSRVELSQGDGSKLPLVSCLVDAVFMSFTLELFDTPEIPVVLQECRRVIRNGGRICVVALSKEKRSWSVELYEWFHRNMPEIVDCRPIFVRQSLEKAGFQVIDGIVTFMWSLPVEVVLAKRI